MDRLARAPLAVQSVHVAVEAAACRVHIVSHLLPAPTPRAPDAPLLEGLLELLEDALLVGLVRVQLEAGGPEPQPAQPPVHHVERGHLLRDEQDALPLGDDVSDQVGDRLGLARPRRALEHHRAPPRGSEDRAELGRVVGERREDLLRPDRFVKLLRRDADPLLLHGPLEGLPGAVKEVRHESVLTQDVGPVPQVTPEQVLREGVEAHLPLLGDLPAVLVLDRVLDDAQHERHIHAVLVLGQRVESRDVHVVIPPQVLQQGHVDARLIAALHERVAGSAGLALDLERDQQERRSARAGGLASLPVREEAHGEIEAVDAALLPCRPRLAVDIGQANLELRGVQVGPELPLPDPGLEQGVQSTDRLVLWSALTRKLRWALEDGEAPTRGQSILHGVELAPQEGDDPLALARGVQEPVPHGQVEELTEPAIQPRLRCLLRLPSQAVCLQVRLEVCLQVASRGGGRGTAGRHACAGAPWTAVRKGRQRQHPTAARPRHVHREPEHGAVQELPLCHLTRPREVRRRPVAGASGVEDADLGQVDPLREAQGLLHQGV